MQFIVRLLLFAALVPCKAAFADDAKSPRSFDFTTVIVDQEGTPYQECTEWEKPVTPQSACKTQTPLTLGMFALAGLALQDQGLTGEEQVRRQALALRIYKAKTVELSADEIKLICDQIAKVHYRGIATLRAWQSLDPKRVQ